MERKLMPKYISMNGKLEYQIFRLLLDMSKHVHVKQVFLPLCPCLAGNWCQHLGSFQVFSSLQVSLANTMSHNILPQLKICTVWLISFKYQKSVIIDSFHLKILWLNCSVCSILFVRSLYGQCPYISPPQLPLQFPLLPLPPPPPLLHLD